MKYSIQIQRITLELIAVSVVLCFIELSSVYNVVHFIELLSVYAFHRVIHWLFTQLCIS